MADGAPIDVSELTSVAVAKIALDGRLLSTNAGFDGLFPGDPETVDEAFHRPRFGELVDRARAAQPGETIHEGALTIGPADDPGVTLRAWVRVEDGAFLLVGEHDTSKLETVTRQIMDLNEELSRAHRELEREIRERRRLEARHLEVLDRLREEELERERLRTVRRIVNRVAHELGTPLTPIQLQLDLIRRRAEDDETKEAISQLSRNIDRIQATISSLRAIAGLEDREPDRPDPADISTAVEQAVGRLSERAGAPEITLAITTGDDNFEVAVDPTLLGQGIELHLREAIEDGSLEDPLEVTLRLEDDHLRLALPALPEATAKRLGETFPLGRLVLESLVEGANGEVEAEDGRLVCSFPVRSGGAGHIDELFG